MDLEIIKDDGSTYRLSDYGIVYDFVVGSIEVERYHDRMEGRSGTIDYGADYGVRRISVPMKFKAYDLHDYAHLRDELYGIVSELEPYYIREMRRLNRLQYDFVDFGSPEQWREGTDNQYVNGKQYRVMLTNEITPEQIMNGGEITLEFVTVGQPFAETIYTTKELNDTGYDVTVEKYGLVDGIHTDYTQYRFTQGSETQNLSTLTWESGMISASTGENASSTRNLRNAGYIDVSPGYSYTFRDTGDNPNLYYWWAFHYDDSDNIVDYQSSNNQTDKRVMDVVAAGTKIRFMAYAKTDLTLNPADVGVNIFPELERPESKMVFEVYNAGNVTVRPENMYIRTTIGLLTTSGVFRITNKTTGESFEHIGSVTDRNIYVEGMSVMNGTTNALRDTNRKFFTIAPGLNRFEVSGGDFDKIIIDFKYYYK